MPPKQPPSTIEIKLNAIERTLEVHSTRMDAIDQKLDRAANLIETNTAQVATFCEGLTRLENSISRLERIMEQGFSRLETMMAQQLELTKQQNETARMQAGHIDRLTGIVELLIQQRVA